jgi:hypothetical protein
MDQADEHDRGDDLCLLDQEEGIVNSRALQDDRNRFAFYLF